MKLITILKKSCYLILYLFVFFNNSIFSAFALDENDIQNNLKNYSSNISRNSQLEEVNNEYILDSGDGIFIAFYSFSGFFFLSSVAVTYILAGLPFERAYCVTLLISNS